MEELTFREYMERRRRRREIIKDFRRMFRILKAGGIPPLAADELAWERTMQLYQLRQSQKEE